MAKISLCFDCAASRATNNSVREAAKLMKLSAAETHAEGVARFSPSVQHGRKLERLVGRQIDFFDWDKKVDWIITNPPYSIYDHFLQKAFSIADNVVFFVPIAKAFKSNKVQKMVLEYGGLKEIVYMGGGSKHGFGFGFPVGCLHYQKGFVGDCKITYVMDGW